MNSPHEMLFPRSSDSIFYAQRQSSVPESIEESKVTTVRKEMQSNKSTEVEGEELLFNARLMVENDSSGFIYHSRTDDSKLLMASGVD